MLSQKLRFCQNLVKSSTSIVTEMAFVVAAANSASNLTQYCQYILSQGNMSPPENESKVYREATLFRVNYERAAWRKHTRGNKEANPPRKSISQLGKHRKEGDYNIFHKDFHPPPIQTKSHRACHELWTNGEHYLGINGEWSTMIPTNAFNGEIPSKYKCSQWRVHEGRDARAICPSLILACFQFIPEISSVSNGENNVFPKYVFFYVMYLYFFVKVSFHVFIPFLPL